MIEQILAGHAERDPYQELADILGLPYDVSLAGGPKSIKPLVLRDVPVFMRWHARSNFSGSDLSPEEVEANGWVIRLLVGRSAEWLNSLSDADLAAVLDAAILANATLFKQRDDDKPGLAAVLGAAEQQKALRVAVAQLVEAGHRLHDIAGYTLRQIDLLSRAHARLAAERQISALVAARAGAGSAKVFKDIVGQLTDDIRAL